MAKIDFFIIYYRETYSLPGKGIGCDIAVDGVARRILQRQPPRSKAKLCL